MLFISILILIVAIALHSQYISSILFIRIAAIVLIYSGAISLNALYIQSIGSGIGIYSGFFHITTVSQYIDTIIYLIASLILIGWPSINNINTNQSLELAKTIKIDQDNSKILIIRLHIAAKYSLIVQHLTVYKNLDALNFMTICVISIGCLLIALGCSIFTKLLKQVRFIIYQFKNKILNTYLIKILNFFIKVIFNCVFMLEFIHLSICDLFCNIYHKTNSRLFLYLFWPFIFRLSFIHVCIIFYYSVISLVLFLKLIFFIEHIIIINHKSIQIYLVKLYQYFESIYYQQFLDLNLHVNYMFSYRTDGGITPDKGYQITINPSALISDWYSCDDPKTQIFSREYYTFVNQNPNFNRAKFEESAGIFFLDRESTYSLENLLDMLNRTEEHHFENAILKGRRNLDIYSFEERCDRYRTMFEQGLKIRLLPYATTQYWFTIKNLAIFSVYPPRGPGIYDYGVYH